VRHHALVDPPEAAAGDVAALQAEVLRLRAALDAERAAVVALARATAHDVLNPMAGLVGFADLLLQPDLAEDERRLVLERIRGTAAEASARLRTMVEELRARAAEPEAAG
jgi:signal transduction histidine kinase